MKVISRSPLDPAPGAAAGFPAGVADLPRRQSGQPESQPESLPGGGLPADAPRPRIGATVIVFYCGRLAPQSNGSQLRAFDLLTHLQTRFERVVLYGYSDLPGGGWTPADHAAFAARFPSVEVVLDREGPALRAAARLKKLLLTLWPALARPVLRARLPGAAPGYRRLRQAHPGAVVFVNYVDGVAQMNGVPVARCLVETHDAKYFRRAKGTGASLVSLPALLRLRGEVATLSAVAGVVAITPQEKYLFENTMPGQRVFHVPVYAPAAAPLPPPGAEAEYDLLFAASQNALNVAGLLGFMTEARDWIGRYRIALCGRICEVPQIRRLAETAPNVTLLGFVDAATLDRLHARSRACLSPTEGTGLKIKLVEALRRGRPVFASDHAMSGLGGGHEDCVFPLTEAAFRAVLDDPAALGAACHAAAACYRRFAAGGDLVALDRALAACAPATSVPTAGGAA